MITFVSLKNLFTFVVLQQCNKLKHEKNIMWTYKQYIDKECTHRQLYGQLVTPHTIGSVLAAIGKERLIAITDEHLNCIPLKVWDSIIPTVDMALCKKVLGFYTKSAGVCIVKEAAQQIIDSNK